MNKEEVLEALERLFDNCEEIDLSLPPNERTGYNMLDDIQKIRNYIIDVIPGGEILEDGSEK